MTNKNHKEHISRNKKLYFLRTVGPTSIREATATACQLVWKRNFQKNVHIDGKTVKMQSAISNIILLHLR